MEQLLEAWSCAAIMEALLMLHNKLDQGFLQPAEQPGSPTGLLWPLQPLSGAQPRPASINMQYLTYELLT